MKKTKRNIAIIVVLLFVCAAIYFNWSYNTQWGKADAEMAAAEDAATAAVKAEEDAAAASAPASDDYFAKARLTRQQSRDEALSLLKSASTAEGASQATIDSAMSAISAMASDSMTETQIENLLLAKNFSECVVYITDEGITVAVPAPADGLSTAQVATDHGYDRQRNGLHRAADQGHRGQGRCAGRAVNHPVKHIPAPTGAGMLPF